MRVLHVASGDLWAGAEVQLAGLLGELARDPRLELAAVFLNAGELERRTRALGIPVEVFDEARLGTGFLARRLREHVADWRPDIVHAHRVKENVLGSIAALGRGRIALVRSVHGSPEAPRGFRSVLQTSLERILFAAKRGHTIAVSRSLHGELANAGVPRLRFIPNGIDPEATRRAGAERCPMQLLGERRVAFAGRLVPVKRVDLFLRAAASIAAVDGGGTRFYVIGDGPLESELRGLARDLRLDERVIFTGFVADCLPMLARMQAVVLTSDHEGTPMVALEALALGVPVVARAVGGLPDIVRSAEQGALVDGDSPEAIAAAITMASRSSRRASLPAEFTLASSAGEYVSLYLGLCAGPDPGKVR